MKKYIGLMIIGLLCAEQALAVSSWNANNCEAKGGERVTVGGQTFCKSTATMNWWSGYAWCQAMGGYMPSLQELCPGREIVQSNSCGYTYASDTWTTTPCNSTNMWAIRGSSMIRNSDLTQKISKKWTYCLYGTN